MASAALRPAGSAPENTAPCCHTSSASATTETASSTAYWTICVTLAERMPAAKLHNRSIATARPSPVPMSSGEDLRDDNAETQERKSERGKRAQDHGEHGKRPDSGAAEPFAEKIGNRVAAEFAEIRREKKRDDEEASCPAKHQQRRPVPSLAQHAGELGKGEHGDQRNGDGHAVEQAGHQSPRDIEIGDRPPQRDRPCPGIDRQDCQHEKFDRQRHPASLAMRYRPLRYFSCAIALSAT